MSYLSCTFSGMELGDLSTDQLEQELHRFESLRRQAASVMVALIAEADRRQVPLGDGCRSTKEWLAGRIDVTSEEASVLTQVAGSLQDLPETYRRLAEGELSVARARTVARVATARTEGQWLERLSGLNLRGAERVAARHDRISRQRERNRHRESWLSIQPSLDESWWRLSGGVGPVAGQVISAAVTERADRLPNEAGDRHHRRALALEAICRDSSDSNGEGAGPSISVFVDLDAANGSGGEIGAELASGPPIGADALAELLCEGQVQLTGLSNGRPVVTTPRSRTIPTATRNFVLWRDGGRCRAPGCESTYRLQPHHIHPRSHGGDHHPDNLLSLCWYHHHVVVHRRGLCIEKGPNGSIRFRLPADSRDPPT